MKRLFFQLGAIAWIGTGIGHFILIDVLTLAARANASNPQLFPMLEHSSLRFDAIVGEASAIGAFRGFSIWTTISLLFFGATYLAIARQPAVSLRPFTWLALALSVAFTVLAFTWFIHPPKLLGLLFLVCFGASLARRES